MGNNKQFNTRMQQKIDTYETSILPYQDCCTIFLPKHPVINPKMDTCIYEENKFNYDELINEAVDNINTIKIVNVIDANEECLIAEQFIRRVVL